MIRRSHGQRIRTGQNRVLLGRRLTQRCPPLYKVRVRDEAGCAPASSGHHQQRGPGLDHRAAGRNPGRRHLARQAEEPAHAARLSAGRGAFHANASDHQYRGIAPSRLKAVIGWERYMREVERVTSSTIRRRLAALSSLYKHLVRYGHAAKNPVSEVERPAIKRDEGSTLAFAKVQARKLLDVP